MHFASGQSSPLGSEAPALKTLADWLRADTNRRVLLRGYSDADGSETFNLKLSNRRARWVKRRLQRAGIDAGRMLVQGLGEFATGEGAPTELRRVDAIELSRRCLAAGF